MKKMFGWQLVSVLVLVSGLAVQSFAPSAMAAEKLTAEQVAGLVPQLFRLHLSQREMTPALTKRMLKEYVTQLDPANRFYLKGEADAIVNLSEDELKKIGDQAINNSDFSHFRNILTKFIDTQIARDSKLYESLATREDEIKHEADKKTKKVATATQPNVQDPLKENPSKNDIVKKVEAAKPDAVAAEDEDEEADKIKWTERPATQTERETRVMKAAAALYAINTSYLSENEAFKLALQTLAEERNKWAKTNLEEQVPILFLKSFMAAMDPHTTYFDAEEDDFAERLERNFAGIGVQIRQCPLGAQVEDIIKGGPSEKSGKFARGDQIVAVDSFPLAGLPINKIVKKIKGVKGSEVKLTVLKKESKTNEIIAIKRDTIELAEMRVKGKKYDTPAGPIGVISVQNFYRMVHKDVKDRINELSVDKPLAGIVLDLRFNQGGYLEEAVSLAGLFIESGAVVGERDGQNKIDWKYDFDNFAFTCPLVILTSQFSASASEIVAGTLKDYNRAVIVAPTQTFGKGTVQRVLPLSNLNLPGEIKITTHQYFVAGGDSTQLKGVMPDVTIPGPKLLDDMLERAADNPVPFNKIDGRIDTKNKDYQRWTNWKEGHLAELQANSNKRTAAQDYKDAFDPKKRKAKAEAEKEKKEKEAKRKPDEAPALDDPKKEEKDFQADEAVAIVQDMIATWPVVEKAAAK